MFEATYAVNWGGERVEIRTGGFNGEVTWSSHQGVLGDLVAAGYLTSRLSKKNPDRVDYLATNKLRRENRA